MTSYTLTLTQHRGLGVCSLSRPFVTPYYKLVQEYEKLELDVGTFSPNQYNPCAFPCITIQASERRQIHSLVIRNTDSTPCQNAPGREAIWVRPTPGEASPVLPSSPDS
jgi:hypothetical protein